MDLRRSPVLLFDDMLAPPGRAQSRLYRAPRSMILACRVEEVRAALEAADAALARGHHIAGWIAFEAAAAFEPRVAAALTRRPGEPLVWFGIFDAPRRLDGAAVADLIDEAMGGTRRHAALTCVSWSEDAEAYHAALARIAGLIAEGDLYQVNHTYRADLMLSGDPLALYDRLRRAQPVGYGAYVDAADLKLLSLSPELFIESRCGRLRARPMKGTSRRGADEAEDDTRAKALAADPKSRAENLMIVDLLRNDLARIARPGSVSVPALFEVERYPTLLQMTSTIVAERRETCRFSDLMAALFPCGSVTGAPKIRALERIAELEATPRGIYTGSIGWAAPDGDLCFNVAIRTLVLMPGDGGKHAVRMGIGSGIVADSDPAAEYAECRLKARFLYEEPCPFSLVETLGWWPDTGFRRRAGHLDRLSASARHFGFHCDIDAVTASLDRAAQSFAIPMRVRLLLSPAGEVSITAVPFEAWPEPVRLAFAASRIDAVAPLRRHKTTQREVYDQPLAAAKAAGIADELVFLNESGEVADGARTTVFIEREGRLLTPALGSGALPGVLRRHLLETGRAREARLTSRDLCEATRLFVGNSLRGLMSARLVRPETGPATTISSP